MKKFIQNRLRQRLMESADTPELVGKFSPEELKQMARLDPYKNKFEKGTYHGKASTQLNNYIDFARYSRNEFYAIVEAMYHAAIKNVPEFKNFQHREHANEPLLELNIEKNTKLEGVGDDDFSVKLAMHATWRHANDEVMGEKAGEIWVLFSPSIGPTRKSISLHDLDQQKKRRAGMKQDIDALIGSIQKKLYGSPDDEDKHMGKKYTVDMTVSGFDEFVTKALPKVRENLLEFVKYIQNKYQINPL